MKKVFFVKYTLPLLALISFILFISAGSADSKQSKPFSWTMALQNVKTGALLPFSAPIQSGTGEQFRLILNSETDCYGYVIVESGNDEALAVLHAGPLKAGDVWNSPVLELSPPRGSESLFVVTSRTEQSELSQRITAFKSNSGAAQRRALMNEVLRIRSQVSRYKEAPEKPVLMGAASRGNADKGEGVEFSGLDTYVKTVSIEH